MVRAFTFLALLFLAVSCQKTNEKVPMPVYVYGKAILNIESGVQNYTIDYKNGTPPDGLYSNWITRDTVMVYLGEKIKYNYTYDGEDAFVRFSKADYSYDYEENYSYNGKLKGKFRVD